MKNPGRSKPAGLGTIVILLALSIITNLNGIGESSLTSNRTIDSGGAVVYDLPTRILQHVEGDRIVDGNGAEVMWRGAGGSYLFHAGDDFLRAWEKHLPEILAMNINTVRLAFAFADSGINPEYGVPTADIMEYEKLDVILAFLDQHGIKAILDCHNYLDMFGDFGSQKLIGDWVDLARRYCGDHRIAAYELFNEPYTDTWNPSVGSRLDTFGAYANLTDAIRTVDPNHIVIWGSVYYVQYDYDLKTLREILQPYLRPNLVFTVHKWARKESAEFQIWTPEQLSYITLDYITNARTTFNLPLWLGEFGSLDLPFNYSNPEYQWTEQTLWRCEEQAIGWNLWIGRTVMNDPWIEYLPFFPLKEYNENITRYPWNNLAPELADYIGDAKGMDRYGPSFVELWHNSDYVRLNPGIIVTVMTSRRLPDGTVVSVGNETITVDGQLTISNQEGTQDYPGDWNMEIFLDRFSAH